MRGGSLRVLLWRRATDEYRKPAEPRRPPSERSLKERQAYALTVEPVNDFSTQDSNGHLVPRNRQDVPAGPPSSQEFLSPFGLVPAP